MAEVLIFHHIQGLTRGIQDFADDLRKAGHTVYTPDLFDGRTFSTIDEGFNFVEDAGFDAVRARGVAIADQHSAEVVYLGFSFGVVIAQQLAQTRPGARGALLIYSCIPAAEFGGWPKGVPVQIHGKADDEYFAEDLPAARELAAATPGAQLFVYPGSEHLFADASLDAYDPDAAALLTGRIEQFLDSLT